MAVTTHSIHQTARASLVILALLLAGCGQYVRDQGRAPAQVLITNLTAAPGAEPDKTGNTLRSDVITNVDKTINGNKVTIPTVFDDQGQVTMSLLLKDPGQAGVATAPSPINQVTFTRYRVTYRRADGRNTPGVDVPFPFDSGLTFTVPVDGTVSANFELVRHNAKEEAPLAALASNPTVISTIAEVQFFGRDQAGNEVTATGSIGIFFGNFGDPG